MKILYLLVKLASSGVDRIMSEGHLADDVVAKTLGSDRRLGSRDRRFLAYSIYDTVRNWRLLQYIASSLPNNSFTFTEVCVLVGQVLSGEAFPAWAEGLTGQEPEVQRLRKKARLKPAVFFSFPDWLYIKGEGQFGKTQWAEEVEALNNKGAVSLRANTIKAPVSSIHKMLKEDRVKIGPPAHSFVEKHGDLPEAIILDERISFKGMKSYEQGYFEVQDPGSQLIARFLNPEPGQVTIDACCGAGGKTLHIAALMNNRGTIFALDVLPNKIKVLAERAMRSGAKIIVPKLFSPGLLKEWSNLADNLLLDVPCSGSGTFRRQVDRKWKMTEEEIFAHTLRQKKILEEYSIMVKKGGNLVYATCSIWREENEDQILAFLENNPRFILIGEKRVRPSDGYDGFYMAKLQRV